MRTSRGIRMEHVATPPDRRPSLHVSPDSAGLAVAAAAHLRAIAAATIARRGRFRIALAGGSTPRAIYPHIISGVDWTRADVFFGDERAALADVLRPESKLPAAGIIHGAAPVWIFCDAEAVQDINPPR